MATPNQIWAETFDKLFEVLNTLYFQGKLPTPLITIATRPDIEGLFYPNQAEGDENGRIHQITINPKILKEGKERVVGELLHQMVHMWQYLYGEALPKTSHYHNKEWQQKMREIGLNVIIPKDAKNLKNATQEVSDASLLKAIALQFDLKQLETLKSRVVGDEEMPKKADRNKTKTECLACGYSVRGLPEYKGNRPKVCMMCLSPNLSIHFEYEDKVITK